MDRQGADFFNVLEQMRKRLGAVPVPIYLPIGADDDFEGVIDLIRMKAIYWDSANFGASYEARDIPAALGNVSLKWHENLVEAAAEGSDGLMEKYLEEGELTQDEIRSGIRARTLRNEVVPVLCGTAFKNKGVQALLDAVIHYLPGPDEVPPIEGTDSDDPESLLVRKPTDEDPFACLAFKIATDPFVGNLTFFRSIPGSSNPAIPFTTRSRIERRGSAASCRCMPTLARRSQRSEPEISPPRWV